jgi:UDP-N-acetylmuramate dehydrogenase
MTNIKKAFKDFKNRDVSVMLNTSLTNYSTMRLSSLGNIAKVTTVDGLKKLGEVLIKHEIEYRIIGLGANQLLSNDKELMWIKLNLKYDKESNNEYKELYSFPASVTLNQLSSLASRYGLCGWEVFTGIPATIGGAVFMNAGTAMGEISSVIESVEVLEDFCTIKKMNLTESNFEYRKNNFLEKNQIIISVQLKHLGKNNEIVDKIKNYLEFRKSTQPLNTKNCGCMFKNYSEVAKAGKYIDILGLKGLTNGNLRVSRKHSNFMENYNDASFDDFIKMKEEVLSDLYRFYGLKFELEVKYL